MRAFLDPEYLDQIRPDELNFIDVDNVMTVVGEELIVIENNEAVPHETTGY
jgi:hypothetical protein